VAGAGRRLPGSPAGGSAPRALFAGLCTLDIIQGVTRMPGRNEKVTALRQTIAAGGPATNAAVTFAFLGGQATLLTGVGGHPLSRGMQADLAQAGVTLVDAASGDSAPPAVSSILVTEGTGDRCVVSTNAADRRLRSPPALDDLVAAADVVLIDGHHPALALDTARLARARGRPCVLDGGSWKPHTADLLPHVDIAVCSADFRPPESASVFEALLDAGVPWVAVTDGPRPVRWASGGGSGGSGDSGRSGGLHGEVPVPLVHAADTLGAGDVFHGAFTHALAGLAAAGLAAGGSAAAGTTAAGLSGESVSSALRFAALVAAHSCRTFGTRSWMASWPPLEARHLPRS
jgi:sugar/nucleoside kinase (ribokinase family)